jgi:hypothetical protein
LGDKLQACVLFPDSNSIQLRFVEYSDPLALGHLVPSISAPFQSVSNSVELLVLQIRPLLWRQSFLPPAKEVRNLLGVQFCPVLPNM